jgi:hypothetical protein
MEVRIFVMHRIDLYNKSRVMGDYQARFCEKLGVKLPLLTRPANVMGKVNRTISIWRN